LNLFDVQTQKQIKPDVDRLELDWQVPRLHWKKDQRHFAYEKVDRGHQRFRVIEVDSHTGQTRNLIDETRQTFIWTAHTENLMLRLVSWLDQKDEIIYVSERDGWRHLYLIDAKEGKIKNQITSGEWVVRGIDLIDEDARQIWFSASGKNPNQDPYLIHYYRVNFDGSDLVALTEGNGTHSIQYSPDRRYLIDTYSRVDMAPVHELRRVSDGKLVCPLEKADITELIADGWTAPEVFVAKGRDGKTDIWGIICRHRADLRRTTGLFCAQELQPRTPVCVADRSGLYCSANRRHGHGQSIQGVPRCVLEESQGRWFSGSHPLASSRGEEVSLL
jgi:hypothetical protein